MDLFDMADGCASLEEGVQRVKCPTLVRGRAAAVVRPGARGWVT